MSAAGKWHGTPGGYTNHRCKCRPCRDAFAADQQRMRANRAARLAEDPTLAPHGKANTYTNWRCRCDDCRRARAEQRARYYRRTREAS